MEELHFYNEDCIEGSKKHIRDNSVDLIICDPPYGIDGSHLDKHYNRNEEFVVDGYVDVPQEQYGDFSNQWINEAARILRPGGSIYVVSGYTNLHHVLNALHSTNLIEINHIIWKYNFGVYTSKKYVSSHYHILYWQKPGGTPTFNTYCRYGDSEYNDDGGSLNYNDREDVFIIDREYKPGEVKNKNELPFALLSKMIAYSSNPGDIVCDMFLGGGSTAIVAKGMSRIPIGFEISKNAFEMATSRINATEPGSLMSLLRAPSENTRTNSGKDWTEDEKQSAFKIYNECMEKGMSKKDTIAQICSELKRGKWGVDKQLEKMGIVFETKRGRLKGSKNKPKEAFEENKPKSKQTTLM